MITDLLEESEVDQQVLTLDDLKAMPPGALIATGVTMHPILHTEEVRWAAKRGGIHDWALYYHFKRFPVEHVLNVGVKCSTKEVIQKLVPCDEEALAMYRY